MSKTEIQKLINSKLGYLGLMIERLSKKLTNCPDGNLIIKNDSGVIKYYESRGKIQTYLSEGQKERIKLLEEKYYYKKLFATAVREKEALEKALKILEKTDDVDQVFLKLPKEKKHLIEPYVFIKDERIIKSFEKGKTRERLDKSSYVTLNGEKVRSKSELILADRFKVSGVLYCYEPPTKMLEDFNEIWHPDFLCLNKRTGETFYWEHFGRMDDTSYLEGFHYRMERYAEAGIVLGKNLIITSETSQHPLNTEYVDLLIKQYLV